MAPLGRQHPLELGKWTDSRDDSIPEPIPQDVINTAAACNAFMRAVGLELCRTVAQFGSLHFTILFYAARFPALRRLLNTNPGLAFAFVARARRVHQDRQGRSLSQDLFDQRENDLAACLGFPPIVGGFSRGSPQLA